MHDARGARPAASRFARVLLPASISTGGIGALAWTAFKVGALSFGGGFVIIPLMQADAVHTYHWMTNAQFLNAVALGQITPGPVVATVAAVGYAAHGLAGGAARRARRVHPLVLVHPPRRPTLRTTARQQERPRVPGRRRSRRDRRDPRRRDHARRRADTRPGSSRSSPPRRSRCSRCAAGSCRRCSAPQRSA